MAAEGKEHEVGGEGKLLELAQLIGTTQDGAARVRAFLLRIVAGENVGATLPQANTKLSDEDTARIIEILRARGPVGEQWWEANASTYGVPSVLSGAVQANVVSQLAVHYTRAVMSDSAAATRASAMFLIKELFGVERALSQGWKSRALVPTTALTGMLGRSLSDPLRDAIEAALVAAKPKVPLHVMWSKLGLTDARALALALDSALMVSAPDRFSTTVTAVRDSYLLSQRLQRASGDGTALKVLSHVALETAGCSDVTSKAFLLHRAAWSLAFLLRAARAAAVAKDAAGACAMATDEMASFGGGKMVVWLPAVTQAALAAALEGRSSVALGAVQKAEDALSRVLAEAAAQQVNGHFVPPMRSRCKRRLEMRVEVAAEDDERLSQDYDSPSKRARSSI